MHGEITKVDVLFSESTGPCVATVKSFVEKTVSVEALGPALTCVWEGGSLCSEQGPASRPCLFCFPDVEKTGLPPVTLRQGLDEASWGSCMVCVCVEVS